VLCRHRRATQYFIESINSACTFRGYRCKSYEDFRQGDCMPCKEWGCGYMGFHADRVKPPAETTNVKYFLKTGHSTPFCSHNYQINILFGIVSASPMEKGKVQMNLIGSRGQLGEIALTNKVNKVRVSWYPGFKPTTSQRSIYIVKLAMVKGETSKIVNFLTHNETIEAGHTQYFTAKRF
ncbi:hypothetical protein CHS0354_034572, partial [Potamilus streckersoni]